MWGRPASWCSSDWNFGLRGPCLEMLHSFRFIFCKRSSVGQRSMHQGLAASAHMSSLPPPACFPGTSSRPSAPILHDSLDPNQPPPSHSHPATVLPLAPGGARAQVQGRVEVRCSPHEILGWSMVLIIPVSRVCRAAGGHNSAASASRACRLHLTWVPSHHF